MAKRKICPSAEENSSDKLKCREFLGRQTEFSVEEIKQRETLKLWLEIFPDAEPDYFNKKYNEIKDDEGQIEEFISENLEKRNYPKLIDKRKNVNDNAEMKLYREFSVEPFLKRFPDAIKYFLDEKRSSSISRAEAFAYAYNR